MPRVMLRPPGDDEPTEVLVERAADAPVPTYQVTIGDRRVEVDLERVGGAPGVEAGLARIRGRTLPWRVVRDGAHIVLWLRGRTYRFERVTRTARRDGAAAAAPSSGTLTAPMPGKILKVNAAPGATFEAHQPLVLMESMKMEMSISVPRAGRVREVMCEEGQLVELGAVLARLEPFEADAAGGGAGA